jgi:hypothetical protein
MIGNDMKSPDLQQFNYIYGEHYNKHFVETIRIATVLETVSYTISFLVVDNASTATLCFVTTQLSIQYGIS